MMEPIMYTIMYKYLGETLYRVLLGETEFSYENVYIKGE